MKHLNLVILFVLTLSVFGLIGCSSSVPETRTTTKISEGIYKDDLRINIKKLYAWVNLMPGAKPRFHITGSVELLDASEYDLENVTIKEINIIQDKKSIYRISPKVEDKIHQNIKSLLFSTVRGLLYTSILDREKKIDVEFLISDSSNEIIYQVKDVEISEVY